MRDMCWVITNALFNSYSRHRTYCCVRPRVDWIVGALEGAVTVGGPSALGARLYNIGIPEDSVLKYELALKSDKFLIIAHGTADEVAKAKSIPETTSSAFRLT